MSSGIRSRRPRAVARSVLLTTISAFLVALACAPESRLPAPNVVARIGEREVVYVRFEEYLERNLGRGGGERTGALASEALSRLFDQFIDEQCLVLLARERGIAEATTPPNRAIGDLLATQTPARPTASRIAAEFERRKAELSRPERVHLRQILVEDRLVAERARRELESGAPFEEVVARSTPAGAAPAGADQGELTRDELPASFAPLIFDLAEGGVSEVVPAGYGFHVFQVVRRSPAHEPTLAEASPELRDLLERAAADAALAALVREARSRYTLEVYDRNLPFTYRGSLPTSRPHEIR